MASVGFVRGNGSRMNSETYTFAALPRALLQQRNQIRDLSKGEDIVRNPRLANRSMVGRTRVGGVKRDQQQQPMHWAMTVRMIPDTTVSPEIFRLKAAAPSNGHASKVGSRGQVSVQNHSRHLAVKSDRPLLPVPGRKHLETQTETYLEELTDCSKEVDAVSQTEPVTSLDLVPALPPPSPPSSLPTHLEVSSSIDAATQIDENELFDFDMESPPVLEHLVTQALRWAVLELVQEEDLADIHKQRRRFQVLRKAYLAGESVINKQVEATQSDKMNVVHSIHSWSYSTQPDAIKTDLERAFLPWIMEEVEEELKCA